MSLDLAIETARLRLRPLREEDREAFAALQGDPLVMQDLGGPIDRAESDSKFALFCAAYRDFGYSRWAVESRAGAFLGCVGVFPEREPHPLGPHDEIGWRLNTTAWGQGYATEAARAALDDVFRRIALPRVLSYTAPDNLRSQAVMARLGLERAPALDFEAPDPKFGRWKGLVWVAKP